MDPLPQDGWIACPSGELDRLVQRLQKRGAAGRAPRAVVVVAGLFASTVLAGVLGLAGAMTAQGLARSGMMSSKYYEQEQQARPCPAGPPAPQWSTSRSSASEAPAPPNAAPDEPQP